MLQILLLMCGFVPNCGLRVGDSQSGSVWQGMHGTFMNARNLAKDIEPRIPEWLETFGDAIQVSDFEKIAHHGNAMKHLGGRTFGTRMRDGFFADDEGTPSLVMSSLANLSTIITKVISDPILKRHAPNVDVEQWKKNSAYFSNQNAPALAKLVNEQGRLLMKSNEARPFLDGDLMDAAMEPPVEMPDWDLLDPSKHIPGLLQGDDGAATGSAEPAEPQNRFLGWPRMSVFMVHKFVTGRQWGTENFDFFQYGFKTAFLKIKIEERKLDFKEFRKPKGYLGFTYGWSWGKYGMKLDMCPLVGIAVRLTIKTDNVGKDRGAAATYAKVSLGGCVEGTWRTDNFDYRFRYCGGVVWKIAAEHEFGLWVIFLLRCAAIYRLWNRGNTDYHGGTRWPKTFDLNFIFKTDYPLIPGTLTGIAPQGRLTFGHWENLGRFPFGGGKGTEPTTWQDADGYKNYPCAFFWKPDHKVTEAQGKAAAKKAAREATEAVAGPD